MNDASLYLLVLVVIFAAIVVASYLAAYQRRPAKRISTSSDQSAWSFADQQYPGTEPKPISYYLKLTNGQFQAAIYALKEKRPHRIREYIHSREYFRDVENKIHSVRDANGEQLASGYMNYTERMLLLALVAVIKTGLRAQFEIHFPIIQFTPLGANEELRKDAQDKLVDGIVEILTKFPERLKEEA